MKSYEVTAPKRLRAPRFKNLTLWETADQRLVYMPDMEDAHLESALRMMLGMRITERNYAKTLKEPYEIDPVLEFRITQLIYELNNRRPLKLSEPKGFWARLFGR